MEDIIFPETPCFITAKMPETVTPGTLITRGKSGYEVYGRGTEYQKFRRIGDRILIEVRGPTTHRKVGDITESYIEGIGFVEGEITKIDSCVDGYSIYEILAFGPIKNVLTIEEQEEKEDRSWMKPEDLI